MKKYLIVEDEQPIREAIVREFQRPPAEMVFETDSGEEALQIMKEHPDINGVILDLQLKGEMYGIEVLANIRSSESQIRNTTVGILTTDTSAGRKKEAVKNFADGYMDKDDFKSPLDIREFMNFLEDRKLKAGAGIIYEFNGWTLDPVYRRLLNPHEAEVELRNSEFSLLVAFVDNPDTVMTHEELIEKVGISTAADGEQRAAFAKLLSRLRKKVDIDRRDSVIENVYGKGFRFTPAVKYLTRK